MRKQLLQKRRTYKLKRVTGLRTPSNKFNPRWEDAGNGLEYLQVGGFFGVWRRRAPKKRRDTSLVRI